MSLTAFGFKATTKTTNENILSDIQMKLIENRKEK
jgi:hypothetical protein